MPPIVRLLALPLLLVGIAGCDREKQAAPQAPAGGAAAQAGVGLDRSHKGQPAPQTVFKDPDGGDIDFTEFEGVPLLVNLWASWCAPCVKELPTLDALAAEHEAAGDIGIIAISEDMGPQGSVEAFLKAHKITRLGAYHDAEMKLTDALSVQTMPTTVLYDKTGHEVWRFVGDRDWTTAESKALIAEAR